MAYQIFNHQTLTRLPHPCRLLALSGENASRAKPKGTRAPWRMSRGLRAHQTGTSPILSSPTRQCCRAEVPITPANPATSVFMPVKTDHPTGSCLRIRKPEIVVTLASAERSGCVPSEAEGSGHREPRPARPPGRDPSDPSLSNRHTPPNRMAHIQQRISKCIFLIDNFCRPPAPAARGLLQPHADNLQEPPGICCASRCEGEIA
jgi:hypothetical protein